MFERIGIIHFDEILLIALQILIEGHHLCVMLKRGIDFAWERLAGNPQQFLLVQQFLVILLEVDQLDDRIALLLSYCLSVAPDPYPAVEQFLEIDIVVNVTVDVLEF